MKTQLNRRSAVTLVIAGLALVGLSGCNTVGGTAADLGLAGAGGVAGYQMSDGKVGGAAAGAALGLVGSHIAQAQVRKEVSEAEARGYDRAMNRSVKQHYWIIQAQQRARDDEPAREAKMVPVVIPETSINGVIQNAHVEYLRLP